MTKIVIIHSQYFAR